MQSVRLSGRTDLTVTQLGLNLAAMARLSQSSPEPASDVIGRAWTHGLRLFDAAPTYGSGAAERRAGACLGSRPRDQYVLATKAGRIPQAPADPYLWLDSGDTPNLTDFSYLGIHRSVEESLDRLGVDYIDVLHLHNPATATAHEMRDSYRALIELRRRGTIRAISAGAGHAGPLAAYAEIGDRTHSNPGFDCFLLAGRYTLLDQSALDLLLPRCAAWRIGVLAAGVLHRGLLATDSPWGLAHGSAFSAPVRQRAAAVAEVCQRHGVPVRAAALQFPLGHPAITSVVVSARSASQIDDTIAMFSLPVPPALWAELKQKGLLAPHAPVPSATKQ